MKKNTISTILLAFLFSLVFLSFSYATLLENIPLDSWVYPVLDELYSQGLFPELHKDVKPYTRGEIAALILDVNIRQRDGGLKLTDSQLWMISKLNQEFKYELEELFNTDQTDSKKQDVIRYGVNPVAHLNLSDGDSSYGRLQVKLDFGIQFDRKFVLKDRVVVDTKAEKDRSYQAREWKKNLAGTFDIAYANIDAGYFTLLLGRDHIRWGPSNRDVLLLSDQIPPFDMIKAEGKIGSFRLTWFATALDQIFVPPLEGDFQSGNGFWAKRYLSGHRLNLKSKLSAAA